MSKRGNRYLRVLFVQAAWVVLVKRKSWERHGLKRGRGSRQTMVEREIGDMSGGKAAVYDDGIGARFSDCLLAAKGGAAGA
jgi:hypothetical protein